jgi:hypothetical protein
VRNGHGEQTGNLKQFGTDVADGRGNRLKALGRSGSHEWEARLWVALENGLGFALQARLSRGAAMGLVEGLAGACERVSLGMDEALDLQHQLYIATAVKALAGPTLVGVELGKLSLPKAQDVGFEVEDACHIANFEVEAVGDGGSGFERAGVGELGSHGDNEEATAVEAEASF